MKIPRFRARIWRRLVFFLAFVVVFAYNSSPYSYCRLAIRLHIQVPLQRSLTGEKLLSRQPPYPVNLAADVALIIKSGFGTKDRLQGSLQFLQEDGPHFSSIILVGDFATRPGQHYNCNGVELPVYDVIRMTIDSATIAQPADLPPKLDKYARLQEAISKDDVDLARTLSNEFGWELDAMKVFPPNQGSIYPRPLTCLYSHC